MTALLPQLIECNAGDVVFLDATFTDPSNANALVDPSTVTAQARLDGGPVATLSVSRVSTGKYTVTLPTSKTAPGIFAVRIEGTGTFVAIAQGTVAALASVV